MTKTGLGFESDFSACPLLLRECKQLLRLASISQLLSTFIVLYVWVAESNEFQHDSRIALQALESLLRAVIFGYFLLAKSNIKKFWSSPDGG